MSTASFYQDLPVIDAFIDVTDLNRYRPLPDDWLIAVADIKDSTGAVQAGKYREVNILGASPIIGILNAARAHDGTHPRGLPFVFGGDGAVVCIPPTLEGPVREVLGAIQPIAEDAYGLTIRAGVVPVGYVREQGYACDVARVCISTYFDQAVFAGGGIAYAEKALKAGRLPDAHRVPAGDPSRADFTGLQCRWQEVPSARETTLSILVDVLDADPSLYREVLDRIRDIFGEDPQPHPIAENKLRLSMSPRELLREVKLHTFGASWWTRLGRLLETELRTLLGKVLMRLGVQTSDTDWGAYRGDMALNADYQKFDDMLRLVISGTEAQREALETYLQTQSDAGRLRYGIHASDTALLTCMVFRYDHLHLHFVDGGEGGYTLAAKAMREGGGQ